MKRTMLGMLVAAIVAVFALGSIAEAAAKRPVRHRVRHSTRVSSSAPAVKKKVIRKKHPVGKAKAKPQKKVVKRKPSTKPR